jgi:hypothetical protein
MQKRYKVLILCTGNSARSQMAEGLLRYMGGKNFEAFSAGTRPAGLNPNAVNVMSEVGIDISNLAVASQRDNGRRDGRFPVPIPMVDPAEWFMPHASEQEIEALLPSSGISSIAR